MKSEREVCRTACIVEFGVRDRKGERERERERKRVLMSHTRRARDFAVRTSVKLV